MKLSISCIEEFSLIDAIEARIRQLKFYAEDGNEKIREAAERNIEVLIGILEKMRI